MRIEHKHVFTMGTAAPKGGKASKLDKTFQKNASINMAARPLAGRVSIPKKITPRGKKLAERMGKIAGKIPTPFLVKPVSGSDST